MRYGLRTERLRELLDGMTSAEIVAHVVPYYHGWQVEGEWLDAWREAVEAECDLIDEEVRRMDRRRGDRSVWRRIKRARESGTSAKDLARAYGVTERTINRRIRAVEREERGE